MKSAFSFVPIALSLGVVLLPFICSAEDDPRREQAHQLQEDGNFQEAAKLYLALLRDENPTGSDQELADDLSRLSDCSKPIHSRLLEMDELREILARYPKNWRLVPSAVKYAATFNQRFQYEPDIETTNRFDWIQWFQTAMPFAEQGDQSASVFFRDFAGLFYEPHLFPAWKLHHLTDLENPPVEDEPVRFNPWDQSDPSPAAVDDDGNPLFHQIPNSYEAAQTDGERWRWLLEKVIEKDPNQREPVEIYYADFIKSQFGVETTQQRFDPIKAQESPLFAWHELADHETVAKLANGTRKITLPKEHRYIETYRKHFDAGSPNAGKRLASVFAERGRYEAAAKVWGKLASIAESKEDKKLALENQKQITGNWIAFETGSISPYQTPATVALTFRNTTSIQFEARKIDIEKFIEDTKNYLASKPEDFDRSRINPDQLGRRLLDGDSELLLLEEPHQWTGELKPEPHHWDTHAELETPLTDPGIYWVKAKAKNGNTAHRIVWITDTIIAHRQLDGDDWFYVADAVSGEPVADAKLTRLAIFSKSVELVRRVNGKKKREWIDQVTLKEKTEYTGEHGDVRFDPITTPKHSNYQRIATATTPNGRLAIFGLNYGYTWHSNQGYRDVQEAPISAFVITDRPAYRPDQTVKFKTWLRQARYTGKEISKFAGEKLQITIHDGRGEKIYEEVEKADAFGGVSGELSLPDDANLGQYRIAVSLKDSGNWRQQGHGSFRVEEYKKPEFEVAVEAPTEPIALGDTFEATVKANYYFGAPVTNATVEYRVTRQQTDSRWFPARPWDWLYGNGYGWFASDAVWHPSWSRWGCGSPRWPWIGWSLPTPELVAKGEVKIDSDGTAKITIDTAAAKALHSDHDHRYEIAVTVIDESRRAIDGAGSVTASRKPFQIYAWTDRGYYKTGQAANAHFRAQNANGKPIAGTGVVSLYQLTFAEDGTPNETLVQQWDLDPNAQGEAAQHFSADEAGQYRIAWKVTTADGSNEEGGSLFTIRGDKNDPADFRFNALELTTEQSTYQPGDTAELLVSSNHKNASVMLFYRDSKGKSISPRLVQLDGKSNLYPIGIDKKDHPNFFVDALAIHNGEVHHTSREIIVPPEKRILDVTLSPASEKAKPGEKTQVAIELRDQEGNPFVGTAVVSIYDKSIEYISGGSNVPDIKKHFWSWKRHHRFQKTDSISRYFSNLGRAEDRMASIELFTESLRYRKSHWIFDYDHSKLAESPSFRRSVTGRDMVMKADSIDALIADASSVPSGGASNSSSGPRVFAGGFTGSTNAQDEWKKYPGHPASSSLSTTLEGFGKTSPPPTIRKDFADSALWVAAITTDEQGQATVSLDMPENLTTWKVKTWAMGHGTIVGEGETEIITSKDLLIRQQAPRFFVEKDEVTLSANVHNYLDAAHSVTISLELEGDQLAALDSTVLSQTIELEPLGEQRIDWKVRADLEGEATIRMTAIAAGDSDAIEMSYPVLVYGALKTEAWSHVLGPDAESLDFTIAVPAERRPEQSRLEIRYSPSLAAAIVDALPYLAEFPYGCTEQTLSRFLPTVISQNTLEKLKIDLSDIREKTANFNARELGDAKERAEQWERARHWDRNPVFSETKLNRMVKKGVARLQSMQNDDGGWGWFSGKGSSSYPHTTAWVVRGLKIAEQNGVTIDAGQLHEGAQWLANHQQQELAKLRHDDEKKRKFKTDAQDALTAYVLSIVGKDNHPDMLDRLYEDRLSLPVYAQALNGLTFHHSKQADRVAMVLRNLEQHLQQDEDTQSAWLELGNGGYWWYWYGSHTEAQAFYLKLLVAADPKSEIAPRLVKWLLNQRKNGSHWTSTRDTALCVEAIADYLHASGETNTKKTLTLSIDGEVKKTVTIDPKSLFDYDDRLIIEGEKLTSGDHQIEIQRDGDGPLYVSTYLTNFTQEDKIEKAGLDVKIERRYFKLTPNPEAQSLARTDTGTANAQAIDRYEREEIKEGDPLASGDLLEVELWIKSINDAEYLLIEDPKPAGTEPVEVRSGYTWGKRGELSVYREYRDEKVANFVRWLPKGEHLIRYRTRAEIPGTFHALPAKIEAMYAPELVGNSDGEVVVIE